MLKYLYFLLSVLLCPKFCNCAQLPPSELTSFSQTEFAAANDAAEESLANEDSQTTSFEDILSGLNFIKGNQYQISYLLHYIYLSQELLQVFIAEKHASHTGKDIIDFDNMEFEIINNIKLILPLLSPQSVEILQSVDNFLQSKNSVMRINLLFSLFELRINLAKFWHELSYKVNTFLSLVSGGKLVEGELAFDLATKLKNRFITSEGMIWFQPNALFLDAAIIEKYCDFYNFLENDIFLWLKDFGVAIESSNSRDELRDFIQCWDNFQKLFKASQEIENLLITFGEEIFGKIALFEETYNQLFLDVLKLKPRSVVLKIKYGPNTGDLLKPNFWVMSSEMLDKDYQTVYSQLELRAILTARVPASMNALDIDPLLLLCKNKQGIDLLQQASQPIYGYLSKFYFKIDKNFCNNLPDARVPFDIASLIKKLNVQNIYVPQYMIKSFLEYKKRYLKALIDTRDNLIQERVARATALGNELSLEESKSSANAKQKQRKSTKRGKVNPKKSTPQRLAAATAAAATNDDLPKSEFYPSDNVSDWKKVEKKKQKKPNLASTKVAAEESGKTGQVEIVMRFQNALYRGLQINNVDKCVDGKYLIFHENWGSRAQEGITEIIYLNQSNSFDVNSYQLELKGSLDIRHLIPNFLYPNYLKFGYLIKPGSTSHKDFNNNAINKLSFNGKNQCAIVLNTIILPKDFYRFYVDRPESEIMELINRDLSSLRKGRNMKGALVFIFNLNNQKCFHQMFHQFKPNAL